MGAHQNEGLIVINELSHLIDELNVSSKNEYAEIGVRLDIPIEQLQPYIHWNTKYYTRNCIARTEHYELILLCWEEDQNTPVHCHGGEECWVYVMNGKMQENHFQFENEVLTLESTEVLQKGDKSFMCDDLGFHQLTNVSEGRSMSLHLYMDPIDTCTKYDINSNSFKQIDLTYYSYKGNKESSPV